MLFSKNKKTNKTVAQIILGLIALQYIGILGLIGFDLSRFAIGTFSISLVLTVIGSVYVLWGITEHKYGG